MFLDNTTTTLSLRATEILDMEGRELEASNRTRITDEELAEMRRRRPGVRASLACEGMHLTAEEEALFAQLDAERLTPDESAKRLVAFHLSRPAKLSAAE